MKLVDFDYAIVRHLPSVCRGEFRNVGVILHAPAADFLAAKFIDERHVRLRRYLEVLEAIAAGRVEGGPLGTLARSERFHWLTAPRSDTLQTSPCHPGRAPADALDVALTHIFEHAVARGESHG